MGKFRLEITQGAQVDIEKHIKSGDKASIKKINAILIELTNTPYTGSGQPETLKHQYTGYWSRKINKKDRLIYQVHEDIVTVYVLSAMGHYKDK
jgi:toxin YoeB